MHGTRISCNWAWRKPNILSVARRIHFAVYTVGPARVERLWAAQRTGEEERRGSRASRTEGNEIER